MNKSMTVTQKRPGVIAEQDITSNAIVQDNRSTPVHNIPKAAVFSGNSMMVASHWSGGTGLLISECMYCLPIRPGSAS